MSPLTFTPFWLKSLLSVSLSSVSLPIPSCKDLSGSMKYRDHLTNYRNRFLKKPAWKCLLGTLFKEKLQGEFIGEAVFGSAVQL